MSETMALMVLLAFLVRQVQKVHAVGAARAMNVSCCAQSELQCTLFLGAPPRTAPGY